MPNRATPTCTVHEYPYPYPYPYIYTYIHLHYRVHTVQVLSSTSCLLPTHLTYLPPRIQSIGCYSSGNIKPSPSPSPSP
ncbi:hypothetical protein EYC84_004898 [Monilinia fructicola]|uniref:Uncharacterized protein n=1 Tax=Monilinia fructicola TaxID=38448 RepID=A0A5M9K1X3_MONFR|nr:hypothetical protein EYC84_004898 [Monilinia fructicola]